MTLEELKHQSLKSLINKDKQPLNEADLTELDTLQPSKKLSKYQQETKKWRDLSEKTSL